MKKKTCLILIDRIFWAIILLLPVLFWLISPLGYSIGGGSESVPNFLSLGQILSDIGISQSSPVYSVFSQMFGGNGVFPMFDNNTINTRAILLYFTYFVDIEILHLLVDFLVFIPRLSHKWLNYLTRADEVD